jgi:hypothetical protein
LRGAVGGGENRPQVMYVREDPSPRPAATRPAVAGAPATIRGLQRALGNRGVGRLLQRRHISQTLPALVVGGPSQVFTPLNFQAGRGVTRVPYEMRRWELQLGHVPDRRAAIAAEQAWLAANGNAIGGPNATLISNTVVVPTRQKPHEETIDGVDYAPQDAAKHWPFVLRLRSTYGPAAVTRAIDVNFGQDKYGYVTRVTNGAQTFGMQVPPDLFGTLFFDDAREFSSFHDVDTTGGRNIRTQAEAMANARDADDQTKLIAEGARWRAVAAKGAQGALTDASRFYPATNAQGVAWGPADLVPYATFPDLFTGWNRFQRAWDIDDAALRARLNQGNWTGTALFANLQAGAADYQV